MIIEEWTVFLTASILVTLLPGPDIIYVLVQSVTHGKKNGIITSLGLVSGIIVHTSLIAFGIASLIKNSESLFLLIKISGAIYLFYLAFLAYKSSANINFEISNNSNKTYVNLFVKGFIMNVLNPKVAIFFLAFFPGFIDTSQGNVTIQIYYLGIIFIIQAFIIFSIVSVISSQLTSFLRGNKKFAFYLKVFQIVVFIGIGVYLIF